ncbi:MAG: hypothetical protein QM820_47915 [Minicystis sp.]
MRLISPFTGFFGLAALASMAVAFPIASSGCGRSACFVFSQSEFNAQGSCPPMKTALAHFTDTVCPGPVTTVDSEGVFTLNDENPAQSLCCYSVTQKDFDPEVFNGECIGPGFGGGGSGGVGGGFGGGSVGVTVGVGGGFMGCVTCNQLLNGVIADPNLGCSPEVLTAWQDLQLCGCADGNPCAKVCNLNLCKNAPVSKECSACLADPTKSGCGPEVLECKNN